MTKPPRSVALLAIEDDLTAPLTSLWFDQARAGPRWRRFLRQFMIPNTPSPAPNSGAARGSGVGTGALSGAMKSTVTVAWVVIAPTRGRIVNPSSKLMEITLPSVKATEVGTLVQFNTPPVKTPLRKNAAPPPPFETLVSNGKLNASVAVTLNCRALKPVLPSAST